MNGPIEIAVAVTMLAFVAALAWLRVSGWRSAVRNDPVLPLQWALMRVGVVQGPLEDRAELVQFAQAARRCMFCGQKQECIAALAAGPGCSFMRFCPNADLLARRMQR